MTPADTLDQLFRRQSNALILFRDLLLREHSALVKRDLEAINNCFAQHAHAINSLEILDHELQALLAHSGSKKLPQNIDHQLTNFPALQGSRLKTLWIELLALASVCRDLNAVNSKLVNAHRTNTESALRILKGQEATPNTLYSQDGKTSSSSPLSVIATV